MTPAEGDKIRNFRQWLINRKAICVESAAKYKKLDKLELTCFYNGKAEAMQEVAERLTTTFWIT